MRFVARHLRLGAVPDTVLGDEHALNRGVGRDLVHDVRHDRLHDRTKAARADLAFNRLFRDGLQRALLKAERHAVVLQKLMVLLAKRVLRLGQDLHEVFLFKTLQGRNDRKSSNELGDDAEL